MLVIVHILTGIIFFTSINW